MAKFNVGDVVEYKGLNEGLCGVSNDGDWVVIRLAGEKCYDEYAYGIYHPSNTGNLYRECTLTKVDGVTWRDLPVIDRWEGIEPKGPRRFLRPFQRDDLENCLK